MIPKKRIQFRQNLTSLHVVKISKNAHWNDPALLTMPISKNNLWCQMPDLTDIVKIII